jgi:hypothetical protein
MGIFNFRKAKPEINPVEFEESIAKKELATKRAKATREFNQKRRELQLLKEEKEMELELIKIQAEIDEYTPEIEEEPTDVTNPNDMMNTVLMGILSRMGQTPQQPQQQTPQPATVPPVESGLQLSEEAIRKYVETLPKKEIKRAKKMTQNDLKAYISTQIPYEVSESSLNKAVEILQEV